MSVQDSTAPVEAVTETAETPAAAETAAPAAAAPAAAAPAATGGREDRHGKKKDKRSSEATQATRELWETAAENKTPHAEPRRFRCCCR